MILSIISIVLAVCAILYCGHCAIVFQRFNDGIKDWSESLDNSTNQAIQRAARDILRDLDAKITEQKEQTLKNDEENE